MLDSLDNLAKAAIGGVVLPISKASVSSMVLGHEMAHWRGVGFPAQGAIPTTASICSDTTVGAYPLIATGAGEERAVLNLAVMMSTVGNVLITEDRLAHMGGLSGTLTTAQAVNLDVSSTTNNLVERRGSTDYSEVQWFLEWYTATGATISTPTANVTFHDNTTGTANLWVLGGTALPASVAAQRRYRILPTNGKYIKSVQSVQLSASTGTAGNFGVTAVRQLAKHECTVANVLQIRDWAYLNLPEIPNNACISFSQICATTTSGIVYGSLSQGKA